MKFLHLATIFLTLVLFNASSCKKEKVDTNKLPLETQEGKNTFGCIVDGSVWVPVRKGFLWPQPFYANIINNNLEILVRDWVTELDKELIISIRNIDTRKTYYLSGKERIAEYINFSSNCYFKTDTINNSGILEITKLDTVEHIISGRFNFVAKVYSENYKHSEQTCKKTINITDGRFDIIYSEQ